jgi:hypothetical protein
MPSRCLMIDPCQLSEQSELLTDAVPGHPLAPQQEQP